MRATPRWRRTGLRAWAGTRCRAAGARREAVACKRCLQQLLLVIVPATVLPVTACGCPPPCPPPYCAAGPPSHSYSWNQQPYDAQRGNALGFATNWDLSGTWLPYQGLFLPYQDEWLNLGPIGGGMAQYNVTYPLIGSVYSAIQADGFNSLSYFNLGEFGVRCGGLRCGAVSCRAGVRRRGGWGWDDWRRDGVLQDVCRGPVPSTPPHTCLCLCAVCAVLCVSPGAV